MIMIKDKVIILLIALMSLSPISSSFAVICYGSDGHITLEPIFHDHCDCPESEEDSRQKDSCEPSFTFSDNHSHCKDTLATSSAVIPDPKNAKPKLAKVFVQSIYHKSISNNTAFSYMYSLLWDTALSSFFTPLRTIILLA